MSNATRKVRPPQPTVLVLCCYRSDELITITFVSVLRQAGLRVKLVGLEGRSCAGRVGVVIKADRTLAEALSRHERIVAIVLPFDEMTLARFVEDAQLRQLVQRSESVLLVMPEASCALGRGLLIEGESRAQVRCYRPTDDLSDFSSNLVNELSL